MGFSASGAIVVLFIGLLVSASYLFPTLEASVERTHEAGDAAEERLLKLQNTEFVVDAVEHSPDTGSLDSHPDTTLVRVTNTGTTTLTIARVDVLDDGAYVENVVAFENVTMSTVTDGLYVGPHEEPTLWLPGETVVLAWEGGSESSHVTVTVETGMARRSAVTEVV